jgi:hypothetical protein
MQWQLQNLAQNDDNQREIQVPKYALKKRSGIPHWPL